MGFDADTLADLRSRGINTPKDLAKDEAINSYVDTCKAVEGYSPSTEGLSLEALENKITELRRYINEGGLLMNPTIYDVYQFFLPYRQIW